jgi:hypothetical protein
VAKEKFHSLSDMSIDYAQWLVASEMEHREQFGSFPLYGLG